MWRSQPVSAFVGFACGFGIRHIPTGHSSSSSSCLVLPHFSWICSPHFFREISSPRILSSFSLIPGQVTGNCLDPLHEAPQVSRITLVEEVGAELLPSLVSGHVLGIVAPDVLLFHQHQCSVDRWWSHDVLFLCGLAVSTVMLVWQCCHRAYTMTATNHDGHKRWLWRPQDIPWWPQTVMATRYTMMATAMKMWKTNGILLRNCQIHGRS